MIKDILMVQVYMLNVNIVEKTLCKTAKVIGFNKKKGDL